MNQDQPMYAGRGMLKFFIGISIIVLLLSLGLVRSVEQEATEQMYAQDSEIVARR